jgi:hypothetical protein
MAENPFGRSPFGTAPFGPSPPPPFDANISIGANAVGAAFAEAVGEAVVAFEAAAFVSFAGAGEAVMGFAADAGSAFSRQKVRVITTAPHTRRSVSTLPSLQTIHSAPVSRRSKTGLSHTGLN